MSNIKNDDLMALKVAILKYEDREFKGLSEEEILYKDYVNDERMKGFDQSDLEHFGLAFTNSSNGYELGYEMDLEHLKERLYVNNVLFAEKDFMDGCTREEALLRMEHRINYSDFSDLVLFWDEYDDLDMEEAYQVYLDFQDRPIPDDGILSYLKKLKLHQSQSYSL